MISHCSKNKIIPYLVFYQSKNCQLEENWKGKIIEEVKNNPEVIEDKKEVFESKKNNLKINGSITNLDDISEESENLETTIPFKIEQIAKIEQKKTGKENLHQKFELKNEINEEKANYIHKTETLNNGKNSQL